MHYLIQPQHIELNDDCTLRLTNFQSAFFPSSDPEFEVWAKSYEGRWYQAPEVLLNNSMYSL